ncbi:uroporphyrinogen-III synthase [Saccharopolyspora sp. 6M]|uniref:uroporphyrinogen-III synthase n=1 Tax=Saccharopolyspora sp. 6M TaxID=2877237 RepID=UPI001CD40C1B|nr:uroporphyrinogen-III synthase [Saccharopolyspora sp. 6M]MCA1226326.1 uroporphyrinogen-III synthase [Saccharopolyspora sp. 6M]
MPLAGFTVGVTAARRVDEQTALLARCGARVLPGAALRIVPVADDARLRAATERCVEAPPSVVVATTGIGFRGWVEAAEGWGLGADLLSALGSARLLARGPKARGAVRAAGLPDTWSPESESSAELLAHLLSAPLAGVRVAVQLHGRSLPEFTAVLRSAGAEVVEVPVYRWCPPADTAALAALVDAVCARELDAVTFTSAPAAAGLLARATEQGCRRELLAALRGPVLAACVGPVTHAPLAEVDVPAGRPRRARLGALVRELCERLPGRYPSLPVAGRTLQLRGHAAAVDGVPRPLSPGGKALLRVLLARPGEVVAREELATALAPRRSPSADAHAVEQAVARLRSALGAPELVQTVIKRGYRLPLEGA